MNSFSEKFPSNCSFGLLWVASSERLHSKDSQLKTRKESKGLKEIVACVLQNGYSKIEKAQGERLGRSSVFENLPCNFIKTELHRWHFPRNVPTFFGQSIHKTPLSDWLERLFICLVSKSRLLPLTKQFLL